MWSFELFVVLVWLWSAEPAREGVEPEEIEVHGEPAA